MKMYKFNELVLVLGSDDAMRVPLISTADFKEIELVSLSFKIVFGSYTPMK